MPPKPGAGGGSRSKPFSAKMKKEQLKAKRAAKRDAKFAEGESDEEEAAAGATSSSGVVPSNLLQGSLGKSGKTNKFSTVFAREKDDSVWKRKVASDVPLRMDLRGKPVFATLERFHDPVLDHPKGVLLRQGMMMSERDRKGLYLTVESRVLEEEAFTKWLEAIYANYPRERLNTFEHSLEVWSQLWHTLASSDVICVVADVRNPLWHIPHSLVRQVTEELKKPLVIVLNKCDLVPQANATMWRDFLKKMYPSKHCTVTMFSSSGVNISGLTSLAQRRKTMKEARLSRDTAVQSARKSCVRQLLEAAGVVDEHVDAVLDRMDSLAAAAAASVHQSRARNMEAEEADEAALAKRAAKKSGGDEDEEEPDSRSDEEGDTHNEDSEDEQLARQRERERRVAAGNSPDGSGDDDDDEDEQEQNSKPSSDSSDDDHEALITSSAAKAFAGGKKPISGVAAMRAALMDDDDDGDEGSDEEEEEEGERDSKPKFSAAAAGAAVPSARDPKFALSDKSARRRERKLKKEMKAAGVAPPPSSASAAGAASGAGKGAKTPKEKPSASAAAAAAAPSIPTLTIGMVGHPNAGKSSVINCIAGEKRVSVSRTAGHTKRAQTVPLVPGVALLDCPGLVFPHALVPSASRASAGEPALAATSSSSASAAKELPASATWAGGARVVVPRPRGERSADPVVPAPSEQQAPSETGALMTGSARLGASGNVAASAADIAFGNEELEQRAIQELLGVIPIAQVREPYTAVRYLAERVPIEKLYGLTAPTSDLGGKEDWSALSLCEALAVKRGYHIAKVGRPDAHAAGREILYDAQDGVLPMAWLPPQEEPAKEASTGTGAHAAAGAVADLMT